MSEAIEVLKGASKFVGVDSCFAILAAEKMHPDDITIRTQNPHVVEAVEQYYWNRYEEYSFLVPEIGGRPYVHKPLSKGDVVECLKTYFRGVRSHEPGALLDIPRATVQREILSGAVKPFDLSTAT